jgi:hypothetical protein
VGALAGGLWGHVGDGEDTRVEVIALDVVDHPDQDVPGAVHVQQGAGRAADVSTSAVCMMHASACEHRQ